MVLSFDAEKQVQKLLFCSTWQLALSVGLQTCFERHQLSHDQLLIADC